MNGNQTEVGEIHSVSGNVIYVQLSDSIKSNMPIIDGVVYRIGQIGTFLKVPLGYTNLYGIVTQIGATAIPENIKELLEHQDYAKFDNKQWLNMVLVGEQIGRKFVRGVSQSPTTGDNVHLVTIKDLDNIYGGYDKVNSIIVGNISVSESLDARLDLNKMVSRHCAILGSTGSGKSNSVGTILEAIAAEKRFKSARILVIDPHGEYNSVLKKDAQIYKINAKPEQNQKELFIPFWALPFDELLSIFSGNLNDQQKDYFREKVIEEKLKSIEINSIALSKEIVTADTPVPFSIKQLWFELDDFERQTYNERAKPETITKKIDGNAESLKSNEYIPASAGGGSPFLNNQAKGILGFLDSIRIKLKDSRYEFLFQPGDYSPNLEGKIDKDLSNLLFEWLGSKEPVTILDLSGIPSEIMASVSGILLKIIYDALFWGQNLSVGGKEQPLLIVLEEAHSYLKSGEDSISSKAVQSIAKEGRKYGVGLLLVTQRPSELDETVLSQCGTIIALRMNNSKDRSHIRAAIQDELQTMIDLLPSLRTGEAIISGESVKIPSRIQFFKLPHAPKSADPIVVDKWMEDKDTNIGEYNKLLFLWRNQNLNSSDGGKES